MAEESKTKPSGFTPETFNTRAGFDSDTTKALLNLKVLIIGLRGVGAEIAKNVILAGVNAVTIYDPILTSIEDLGANFFLSETDVGKISRANAAISHLKELNPFVTISSMEAKEFTAEKAKDFSVVVVTELLFPLETLYRLNEVTRENSKGFVLALALGVTGAVFVDFGNNHTIKDPDGIPTKLNYISFILKGNPTKVIIDSETGNKLSDGDYVKFSEVEGMTELNSLEPVKITIENRGCFSIPVDSSKFGKFTGKGIVESVKMEKTMSFVPLVETIKKPKIDRNTPIRDYSKTDKPESIHTGLSAIFMFFEKNGRLPFINNEEDAIECRKLAQSYMGNFENLAKLNIDLRTSLVMSRFARCQITPMTSFIGGVAGQEVLKYVGKYTPLNQWLYYEILDTVPRNPEPPKTLARYSDYAAIYGTDMVERLSNLNLFMVGAGALGCELIKGFALMGACCGTKGELHNTDNDLIEWTNLNRQFLFRESDVGKAKSEVACQAGKRINKDFKYVAYKDLVISETEPKFNAEFWESKDIAIGAVDNMEARRYVNSKCLWYGKDFLDSGTTGSACNNLVILNGLTKSFMSVPDPPQDEQIPMCTLKNFPNRIEHTIEWARSIFEDHFCSGVQEVQKLVKESKEFMESMKKSQSAYGLIKILERIKMFVMLKANPSVEQCTYYARKLFDYLFYDTIAGLLAVHPLGKVEKGGMPFWSASRRPPEPIKFDPDNKLHNLFVVTFVKLVFKALNHKFTKADAEKVQAVAKDVDSSTPAKVAKEEFETEEKVPTGIFSESDLKTINELFNFSVGLTKGWTGTELTPLQFEKDDELIIDLVHSSANIRAQNYKIKQCDKQKTKFVAGRIVPAMATTTALIVGAVLAELLKIVKGSRNLKEYRAFNINTAINMYYLSAVEPAEPIQGEEMNSVLASPTIAIPKGHTEWDKIELTGPLTLKEFIELVKQKYNVNVQTIMSGTKQLFNKYSRKPAPGILERLLEDRYDDVTGGRTSKKEKYLEIAVIGSVSKIEKEGKVDYEAILPKFKYMLTAAKN